MTMPASAARSANTRSMAWKPRMAETTPSRRVAGSRATRPAGSAAPIAAFTNPGSGAARRAAEPRRQRGLDRGLHHRGIGAVVEQHVDLVDEALLAEGLLRGV